MPAKGDGKWARLLASNKDLQRWHRNLARGSPATADNYLRILGRFLEVQGIGPMELLSMDPKRRDDALDDFVNDLLAQGRAGSTCAVYKKSIVSWLAFHGESLQRKLKIPDQHLATRASGWQIPSQDKVRQLLDIAPAREKVAIACIAFSGVRPQVLGNYKATDGLRLEHLSGVELVDGSLHFDEVPCAVNVPRELSKTGRPYITFLGPEACEYLANYVHVRILAGEQVTLDSPVIAQERGKRGYIRAQRVGDIIRALMRRVGIREPPYILRSYFDTRLMHAEGHGLTRDMRQFMMGHAGDMEHKYTFHKKLPHDTFLKLRRGYQSALPHLESRPGAHRESSPKYELAAMLLAAQGVPAAEVEAMDLESKTDEEIDALLAPKPQSVMQVAPMQVSQRVVQLTELAGALAEGWKFKQELRDGSVLIEA